jgi:hypothetical protein
MIPTRVIPAQAGIQCQRFNLGPGLCRGDDYRIIEFPAPIPATGLITANC